MPHGRSVCEPVLQEQILRDVLQMIAGADLNQPPPVLGQRMYQRLRELTGTPDLYQAAKERLNRLALDLLPELSARIEAAADPFELAVRFVAAGNVIDPGAKGGLGKGDVKLELELALTAAFAGDLDSFRAGTAMAGSILYLADNAGEIVLDRFLIEQLPAGRVTVAVRGRRVINVPPGRMPKLPASTGSRRSSTTVPTPRELSWRIAALNSERASRALT
jgi:uncharacterized protein with ATP-grasp and redox domains